ncbi:MAG TPA: hypothetical protein VL069_04150 [Opitutus sp.]|nr:hypothetical protein [Opitutus sp.]
MMVCSRSSIFVKVCAFFCATSFAIVAAETSPVTAADPLAVAKRDYEAFKASGTQAGQQGGLNLRLSLPALETAADAPPMPSPIQRARILERVRTQQSAARSENWLIDGVKNNSAVSTASVGPSRFDESSEAQGADARHDMLREQDGSIAAGLRERGTTRAPKIESTEKLAADRLIDTYNPLDGFMSKWLTPRDFERLKSTPARSERAGSTLPPAPLQPLTSVSFSPVIDARPLNGEIVIDERGSLLGGKSHNPYLAELPMSTSSVSSIPAPELPERVSPNLMPSIPVMSPTTDSMATPPAKPSLSEALKTEDQSKFFKQLKRF